MCTLKRSNQSFWQQDRLLITPFLAPSVLSQGVAAAGRTVLEKAGRETRMLTPVMKLFGPTAPGVSSAQLYLQARGPSTPGTSHGRVFMDCGRPHTFFFPC